MSLQVPFVDAEKHSVTLGEIIETIPAKATVAKALVNARLDFDRLMGKPVALIQLLKMIGPFFATESADVETPTPPAVGILGDSTKTIIAQSLIDSVEDSLRECDQVVSWVSSRVRSHTPGGEPTERLARTSSRLADLLPAVALLQQCAFIGALNRSFLHMLAHCLQSVCLLAKAIGIVGVLPDEFRALVTTFSQTSSGLLEKNINETAGDQDVTKREMEALPNVRYHMEQLLRVLNQIGQKHKVDLLADIQSVRTICVRVSTKSFLRTLGAPVPGEEDGTTGERPTALPAGGEAEEQEADGDRRKRSRMEGEAEEQEEDAGPREEGQEEEEPPREEGVLGEDGD